MDFATILSYSLTASHLAYWEHCIANLLYSGSEACISMSKYGRLLLLYIWMTIRTFICLSSSSQRKLIIAFPAPVSVDGGTTCTLRRWKHLFSFESKFQRRALLCGLLSSVDFYDAAGLPDGDLNLDREIREHFHRTISR